MFTCTAVYQTEWVQSWLNLNSCWARVKLEDEFSLMITQVYTTFIYLCIVLIQVRE